MAFAPLPGASMSQTRCGMQRSHHFHGQMSDTFRAAVFVTLSGGFQDAYTYSLVTEFTDIRAIWVCCGLLLISFILMFIRDDQEA